MLSGSEVKGEMNYIFPPLTSTSLGVMMPTRRQPDKLDAASNNFCSIRTLNVDHTEFGIDPRITP